MRYVDLGLKRIDHHSLVRDPFSRELLAAVQSEHYHRDPNDSSFLIPFTWWMARQVTAEHETG